MEKLISVVVPCYNEEETIAIFYKTVNKLLPQLRGYQIEYVFVDDGSKDGTLPELKKSMK